MQRALPKQWTHEEDERLIEAVGKHGEDTDSWKTIALAVPGRTNKACRKRWKHSLHPSIKKTPWEVEEDELLINLYTQHPGRWAQIASQIPGRTDDACAKRYREALDPNLKKDDWTHEEDEKILELFRAHGSAWGKIAEELGRSGLACRNRWRLLERRVNAAKRRNSKPSPPVPYTAEEKGKQRSTSPEDNIPVAVRPQPPTQVLYGISGPSSLQSPQGQPGMQPAWHAPAYASQDAQATAFPPSGNLKPGETSLVDPSFIPMALGKCPCGCSSGNKPCRCTTTMPTLASQDDNNTFASLDWNQLFPYLQAELPTVFVEPPAPTMNDRSADHTSSFPFHNQTHSQGSCLCSSRGGCCAPSTTKDATIASVDLAPPPKTSCCATRAASPRRPGLEASAEAAKLVLDYAASFSKRSPGPQMKGASPDPQLTCQMPASQFLINVIEKYQETISNSPAGSSSGLPGGCPCGCNQPSHNLTANEAPRASCCGERTKDDSPMEDIESTTAPQTSSLQPDAASFQNYIPGCNCGCAMGAVMGSCSCGCVGICLCASHTATSTNVASQPTFTELLQSSTTLSTNPEPPKRSCCSAKTEPTAPPPGLNPNLVFPLGPPASANLPIEEYTLPSYIPGCGCGCAENAPPGTCSCGCIGTCHCSSSWSSSTSSTAVASSPAIPGYGSAPQNASEHTSMKSCCNGRLTSAESSPVDTASARGMAPRLSAQLQAPLPAYACGHPDCWTISGQVPQNEYMNNLATASFFTSGELLEHRRVSHSADGDFAYGSGRGTGPSGTWQFRCGLAGCEKGWKSINGIQYHLQLSRTHFSAPTLPEAAPESPTDMSGKPFKCTHTGCQNSYKQASGLKYHRVLRAIRRHLLYNSLLYPLRVFYEGVHTL